MTEVLALRGEEIDRNLCLWLETCSFYDDINRDLEERRL